MNLEYGYPPVAQFGGTLGYTIVLTEPVSNPPVVLEAGYPANAYTGGTQGYTLVLSDPAMPPLVLEAGYPAVANATGTLGYTLAITNVPTYKYADTELERRRMTLTLASRSIGMELARKKLTMEVEA
ncbi:hypothetical protein ACFV27_29680 [Streptomyces antimycoticus]|uniref:hypothetical protein n=1 Tax=Streptomyces antimycoticus TaxID=68175 RepID=UPI00368971F1